jgi:predicted ferric reductase
LRRADALVVVGWASAALSLALYFASGLVELSTAAGAITSLGIATGLVGSDLVLIMLVLAARIPALDRAVGHDRAIAAHRSLGKPAFYLLLAHGLLLTLGYSLADGSNVVTETVSLFMSADMPLTYLSIGLFVAVIVTSVVAVHRRLPYEAWYVIHLLSYAAVLTALPHQFSQGGILAAGTWQQAYWIGLYVVALGAIVVFRILRPAVASIRHGVRVESVERIADDAISIRLAGHRLDRLGVRAGQFFFWRFWTGGTWWHAHPLSLSAAPDGRHARITVRQVGHGTRALAGLRPGTPVSFSGPFGLFTERSRLHRRVAIIAAGIGVTPARALLDELGAAGRDVTMLVRASREGELYFWDELDQLRRVNGMALYRSVGERAGGAEGWLSADDVARGVTLASAFPRLAESDVYICGPDAWADIIEARARVLGVRGEDLHRERFVL